MKINIAKTSGFCMGVKRAMQLAMDTAQTASQTVSQREQGAGDSSCKRGNVYTIGPLIHNPQAIEHLNEKGVGLIEDIKEAKENDTIIIRAHGVTQDVLENLRIKGCHIVDATCPHVVTSQRQIKEYSGKGYDIFIIGDPNHPEIQSLSSFAERFVLIKDFEAAEETARSINDSDEIMIIAQTTYNAQGFEKIANFLKGYSKNAVICNSICLATSKRQEEIEKLASSSDAVVIVGGKNSANTKRLAQIAAEYCSNVKHVETEKELNKEDYKDCKVLAVSAGASTPEFITSQVVSWLEKC